MAPETTLADAVRIVECRPGEAPAELPAGADARRNPGAVVWVDVDLRHVGSDTAAAARELDALLEGVCPEVDEEMLDDLLTPDLWPRLKRYGAIRAVSAASLAAEDPSDPASRAGTLTFEVVEMLAGDGWLVTCWHSPRQFSGSEEQPPYGELGDHGELARTVEEEWVERGARTAGDLGLIVLDHLVDTYPDVRRALSDWLEAWELDFYRRCETDAAPDRRTLIELRALLFEFRKSVAVLNAPGGKARTYWFADVSDGEAAERLDDRVDRALRTANELSDRLRSALDLVQLQLSQVQGRRTERLHQKVEVIASVLLVPTLVAGTYGANTKFPGLNEGWGTVMMLVLMVVGGLGTFVVLRWVHRRDERALEREGQEAGRTPAGLAGR
ncbi:MAG TPA: CorA family divalent cation transporter [Thermoleophilaceae bacterium]